MLLLLLLLLLLLFSFVFVVVIICVVGLEGFIIITLVLCSSEPYVASLVKACVRNRYVVIMNSYQPVMVPTGNFKGGHKSSLFPVRMLMHMSC